ncbi:MAG: alpha,alpha-trehalase TreF [Bacteroidota bacterium]|nr:alpha,alpha-trehalase TreF [Bacteroidota bacterium]
MSGLLPDGKTFPDCIAKEELALIQQKFDQEKHNPGFSLLQFIQEHFEIPPAAKEEYHSSEASAEEHLQSLWQVLTRTADLNQSSSSLIPLPHPYIVPGGRFREIYYWDSYFTMLGLQASGRSDLVENMISNFAYLIDHIGYIPNGNRTYFLGRSQPPFFALMVQLLRAGKGDNVLQQYLPQLEKEYAFWMKGADGLNAANRTQHRCVWLEENIVLNRYWDEYDSPRPEAYKVDVELSHASVLPQHKLYRHLRAAAESGWDFSSRWCSDPLSLATIHTTDIIPVDLNCLLYYLEQTLCEAYRLKLDKIQEEAFAKMANKRKQAIQRYCWDEALQLFTDYDFPRQKSTGHATLATVFPMYFSIATQQQADLITAQLKTIFLKEGGLVTTPLFSGQQWDAPNGWAPLQWMAVKGLQQYQQQALAKEIAERWIALNEQVYRRTGKFMEKYNVIDTHLEAGGGEYPGQDGFGWTNGVFLAMKQWLGN